MACLGTSHNGGAEEYDYFYEGCPDNFPKYLEEQGIENYTYNGGESSSLLFYPKL